MSAVAIQQDTQLVDPINNLPAEQSAQLRILLAEYRQSCSRVENELLYMAHRIFKMHEILGEDTYDFCKRELGMERWNVNRILQMHRFMRANLSTDGATIDVPLVSRFKKSALQFLLPITDEDVIHEVKTLAVEGNTIDIATVRKIIQRHEEEAAAKVATAEAEKQRAEEDARRAIEQREIDAARHKVQLAKTEELLQRETALRQELDADVERLNAGTIQIQEKEVRVEVLPPGYQSAKEATDAATAELQEAETRISAIQEQIESAQARHKELTASLAELESNAEQFNTIKTTVDGFLIKFPHAHLQAITTKDEKTKLAILAMGKALAEAGERLCAAASAT